MATHRRRKRSVEKDEPDAPTDKIIDLGTSKAAITNGVPCVYFEKGVTKNMGDYNSARVTIGMLLPINYTDADLKAAKKAIDVMDRIIVERLEQEVEDLIDD